MKIQISVNIIRMIQLVSRLLYTEPSHAFRELIANGFDSEVDRSNIDSAYIESRIVDIRLAPDLIEIEDYGRGLRNQEEMVEAFTSSKSENSDPEIIGQFGIGRLATFKLGNKFTVRSNNGEIGFIQRWKYGEPTIDSEVMKAEHALAHRGTQVEIPDPKYLPSPDTLSAFVKRVFSLKMHDGFVVRINGKRVLPSTFYGVGNKPNVHLQMSSGAAEGYLYNGKSSQLQIYQRKILVANKVMQPDRACDGWINCDMLVPTIYRNDIVEDSAAWAEFKTVVGDYIKANFPKREDYLKMSVLRTTIRSLLEDVASVAKELGLVNEGLYPIASGSTGGGGGTGSKPTDYVPPSPPRNPKIHIELAEDDGINKPIRKFGFLIWTRDLGPDEQSIQAHPPNALIFNIGHPLMKLIEPRNERGGGTEFYYRRGILIPLFARGILLLTGQSVMGQVDFNKKVDDITFRIANRSLRHRVSPKLDSIVVGT